MSKTEFFAKLAALEEELNAIAHSRALMPTSFPDLIREAIWKPVERGEQTVEEALSKARLLGLLAIGVEPDDTQDRDPTVH